MAIVHVRRGLMGGDHLPDNADILAAEIDAQGRLDVFFTRGDKKDI